MSDIVSKEKLDTKYRAKSEQEWNEDINKRRTEKAMTEKKTLEEKLRTLNENIDEIKVEGAAGEKSHRMTKEERRKHIEEEKEKEEEAKEFARKMATNRRKVKEMRVKKHKAMLSEIMKGGDIDKQMEVVVQGKLRERIKEMNEEKKTHREKEKKERAEILNRFRPPMKRGEEEVKSQKGLRHSVDDVSYKHLQEKDYYFVKAEKQTVAQQEKDLFKELSMKKQLLAEKRDLHRPMKEYGIEEHNEKYKREKEKAEDARRNQKFLNEQRNHEVASKLPQKSDIQSRVLSEDRKMKEKKNKERKVKQDRSNNMRLYSQKVKELYIPESKRSKEEDREKLLDRIHTKPRKAMNQHELYEKNQAPWRDPPVMADNKPASDGEDSPKKKNKKLENTKSQAKLVGYSHDWLSEQREARKAKEEDAVKAGYKSSVNREIETLLSRDDIPYLKKCEMVKRKAQMLEDQAMRKETLYNITAGKGGAQEGKLGEEVSDLFINAIKAKLSLLDQV